MCEQGLYGENCLRKHPDGMGYEGDWYNPFLDFDIQYWADMALAGTFNITHFVFAVLQWVFRLLMPTLDFSKSISAQLFTPAYSEYMLSFYEDGEMLSDWLTHAPSEAAGVVWMVVTFFVRIMESGGI